MTARVVEGLRSDLRLALRRLRATPVFATFATLSLALGLGATTAMYAAVASLLWSTPPLPDADRIAVLTTLSSGGTPAWGFIASRDDFDSLRRRVSNASPLAATVLSHEALSIGDLTSSFLATAVTGDYGAIVRPSLLLGRGLDAMDDRPGADAVVVLAHEFWASKLRSDPSIVGRTVTISSRPFVVIGVAAASMDPRHDLIGAFGLMLGDGWIPMSARPLSASGVPTRSDEPELTIIGRLSSPADLSAVATEFAAIGGSLDRSSPRPAEDSASRPPPRRWSASTATDLGRARTAETIKLSALVVSLVGLVLIIACTNLANLMLGRGAARRQELAVRRALGASRARLVRELCAESAVVCVLGGLAAWLVARVVAQWLSADLLLNDLQVLSLRPALDTGVSAIAAIALMASLVIFGVLPALQLTRSSQQGGHRDGDRQTHRWKGRRYVIAFQVALSTTLLLGAIASTRSVVKIMRHDPGFDLSHLAVAAVDLVPLKNDGTKLAATLTALTSAADAPRGFRALTVTAGLPISSRPARQTVLIAAGPRKSSAIALAATSSIFETLGVPILRGRGFDAHDGGGTTPIIVVSEQVARSLFDSVDVVGRSIQYTGRSVDATPMMVDIIGVAADTDVASFLSAPVNRLMGTVYVPIAQDPATNRVFLVGRTAGDPAGMTLQLAAIAHQAAPDVPIAFSDTATRVMTQSYVVLRAIAIAAFGLCVLAVVLSMVGLYGVLSQVVARRTREIGVRLALGAEPGRVRRMILAEGLHPVGWGLGGGVVIGVAGAAMLRVGGFDFMGCLLAMVTLVPAGIAACYLPSLRASRVDPNVALRNL